MKNLVLGGIGSFTLVDKGEVDSRDLGKNFLLTPADLKEGKAKAIASRLNELNPSVAGSFVDEDPVEIIANNSEFFRGFSVVIATQIPLQTVVVLDDICREEDIVLMVIRSRGFNATMRVSLEEHVVIDPKPEVAAYDLRLSQPWPELWEFARQFDLDSMDDTSLRRVPFVVLLLHAARDWKIGHGGDLPKGLKDHDEFKCILNAMRRTHDEENFAEALDAVRHIWKPKSMPRHIQRILDDDALDLTQSSPDFWFKISGLVSFLKQNGGAMPLDGNIPDMTCTTDAYITLQRIYRDKAELDAELVREHVQAALKRAGRNEDAITIDDVRSFCKNASQLRVLRWRTFSAEATWQKGCGTELSRHLATIETQLHAAIYVIFRAVDIFLERHGRQPGVCSETNHFDAGQDVIKLKAIADGLLSEIGMSVRVGVLDDLAEEAVRCGGSELHTVASMMGGIGAQEIIKIVTQQYVPCARTLIYDAVKSTIVSLL